MGAFMFEKKLLVDVLAIIVVALIAFYFYFSTVSDFTRIEIEEAVKGRKGYVSDEVWYVGSARTILIKIFGLEPKQINTYGVTVIFSAKPQDTVFIDLGANLHNVTIRKDFTKLSAIYVNGTRSSVQSYVEYLREKYTILEVVPGWILPDHENIHNYINWEHPPLVKYLIALAMITFGDYPLYWRIPVLIIGVLTSIIVYLILRRLIGNIVLAFVGTILAIIDPLAKTMFSITLLDSYVVFFAVLALYLVLINRHKAALLVAIFSGLFKTSGLFATIPVIYLLARREARSKGNDPLEFISSLSFYTLNTITLYFSSLGFVSLPIIRYMGLYEWLRYSVLRSIEWHLTVKCTGPQCPISSSPWDWFIPSEKITIARNSFALFVYPDGTALHASGFAPLWLIVLLLTILLTPLFYTNLRRYSLNTLFLYGLLGGYIAIWILGSRTQYSFYAIHLEPFIYINTVLIVYILVKNPSIIRELLNTWIKITGKIMEFLIK